MRRMAVSRPNRWQRRLRDRAHLLRQLAACSEENEVYDFSLGGIRALYSTGLELRRNYLNGRWTALLDRRQRRLLQPRDRPLRDGERPPGEQRGRRRRERLPRLLESVERRGASRAAPGSSATFSLQPVSGRRWPRQIFGFSAQPDCQNVANATGLDCALSNTQLRRRPRGGRAEPSSSESGRDRPLINDTSINAQYGMGAGTLPENSGVSASFDILDAARPSEPTWASSIRWRDQGSTAATPTRISPPTAARRPATPRTSRRL